MASQERSVDSSRTDSVVETAGADTESSDYILLDDVRKTFDGGEIVAIESVDLSIAKDEFLVLLGPSGCGKTTTLRCIAGLETPDSGRISIEGQDVTDEKPKDRDLAFVFQSIALFPHMSVRKNIRFGLDMTTDLPSDEQERRVEEVADLLGIGEMLDRKPAALSGGQQQRVSLGRAMVIKPKAFLLDEPFSALDANLRDQMRVEVKRLQRELETSMIFVTHDQEEALTLGDRIVVMDNARIVQIGTPHEIYNEPNSQFIAQFIGSPSANLFDGTLERSDGELRFVTDLFEVPFTDDQRERIDGLAGDAVTLGIRPEYMELSADDPLFEAELDVTKPSGAQDTVYLEADEQPIRAVTAQGSVTPSRSTMTVGFDIERAWLFDDEGDRLV